MKILKHSGLIPFLLGFSSGNIWNYKSFGADWPEIDPLDLPNNKCGGLNQSPIDLKTTGWPIIEAHHDKFNKVYYDQSIKIEIAWTGHTT